MESIGNTPLERWYPSAGTTGLTQATDAFGPSSPPSSSICRADARKAILSATPAASDVPPHLHGVSVQSGKGPPWLEVSEAFSELVKKAACVWPLPLTSKPAIVFYCVTSPGWLAGHACPLISRSRFLSITPLRDEIHAMSARGKQSYEPSTLLL